MDFIRKSAQTAVTQTRDILGETTGAVSKSLTDTTGTVKNALAPTNFHPANFHRDQVADGLKNSAHAAVTCTRDIFGKGAHGATVAVTQTKDIFGETTGTVKKTLSSHSGHSSHHRRGKKKEVHESETTIFCSEMYSVDFILEEMKRAQEDTWITNITFEDTITRDCDQVSSRVKDFIWKTAKSYDKTRLSLTHTHKSNSKLKRHWETIVFLDVISGTADYQSYKEKRIKFLTDLNQHLKANNREFALPIRCLCKIEIYQGMDVISIMDVLKTVERDEALNKVLVPGFEAATPDETAQEFASMVDEKALEWKGQPFEFILRYHFERTINPETKKIVEAGTYNPRAKVVYKCKKALEKCLFKMSCTSPGTEGPVIDLEVRDTARRGALAGGSH